MTHILTDSTPPDDQAAADLALKRELTSLQCAIWLLEARQADVRQQLAHYRLRRAGLGRTYRQLLQHINSHA